MSDFLTKRRFLSEEFQFPVSGTASPDLVGLCRHNPQTDAPLMIGTKDAVREHIVNNSDRARSLSRLEAAEFADRLGLDLSPRYGR